LRHPGLHPGGRKRGHKRLVARVSKLFSHAAPKSGATHIAAALLAPIEGTGL
jgi:hypothetical protein